MRCPGFIPRAGIPGAFTRALALISGQGSAEKEAAAQEPRRIPSFRFQHYDGQRPCQEIMDSTGRRSCRHCCGHEIRRLQETLLHAGLHAEQGLHELQLHAHLPVLPHPLALSYNLCAYNRLNCKKWPSLLLTMSNVSFPPSGW